MPKLKMYTVSYILKLTQKDLKKLVDEFNKV